ncbi:hypothetical protein ElyMa_001131200 [Elysia marginata]|uniref:Uncharacterized protein n=1 Tax=Elysia marginata TaxID=1093978 RepID=A0AAV4HZ69_9GAST|nr:hypothetical protein ElyMa_001131200 [Elysia marginata]
MSLAVHRTSTTLASSNFICLSLSITLYDFAHCFRPHEIALNIIKPTDLYGLKETPSLAAAAIAGNFVTGGKDAIPRQFPAVMSPFSTQHCQQTIQGYSTSRNAALL